MKGIGKETGDRLQHIRRAIAWFTVAALIAMCLTGPPPVQAGPATGGSADVLFMFTPVDYLWGAAAVNGTADAVSLSRDAADGANIGFTYDAGGAAPSVVIKGLAAPADGWRWSLLQWAANGSWQEWTGPAANLMVAPGGAIAWCPSDSLPPVPDPSGKYPWPMFKSNAARTGGSLSPVPAGNLTFWTRQLDAPVLSSPCAASGRLFVVAGGGAGPAAITALNMTDGSVAWRRELGAPGPQLSSPAYSGGLVIVGQSDGKLRAFEAATGEPAWEFDTPAGQYGITSSPAIVNGDVLFAGADGVVRLLDGDGRLVWQAAVNATSDSASSPAVWVENTYKPLPDRVVTATEGGGLACLNLSDGGMLWSVGLGLDYGTGLVAGTPAVSQFAVSYIPVINRDDSGAWTSMNLYSVYLGDSVYLWNTSYSASSSSPVYWGDGLFMGTSTEFIGHHPTRDSRMWGVPLAPVDSSPAAAGGYIYFALNASNGTVGCVRVGGFLEWTCNLGTAFCSSPIIADGRLFVCGMNGMVFCLGRTPQPRLAAILAAPSSPPTAGAAAELRAAFCNTGEADATFTAYLTVDGNRTAVKRGPLKVPAGGNATVVFEWKAEKGSHRLNLSIDGADAAVTGTAVDVKGATQACAIIYAIVPVVGFFAAAPMILAFSHRPGGRKR